MVKVMKIVKRRDCMSICEFPIFQKVNVLKRPAYEIQISLVL